LVKVSKDPPFDPRKYIHVTRDEPVVQVQRLKPY
jgi:hypothetical protein